MKVAMVLVCGGHAVYSVSCSKWDACLCPGVHMALNYWFYPPDNLKAENACAHPYTTDFWPCLWNARVMTNGWDRALLVSERTDNAGATSHPSAGGGRLVRRTGTVCSFHFGMYESCSIPSSQDVAGYGLVQ